MISATINGNAAHVSYNSSYTQVTLSYTFAATAAKTITGIAVATQPDKMTYTAGEALDLSGLSVTLLYNDGTSANVAFADFSAHSIVTASAHGTVLNLAHNNTTVSVSCNGRQAETDALTVHAQPADPPPPDPPKLSNLSDSSDKSIEPYSYWIEPPEAKTMAYYARQRVLDYARSRRSTITGIRKKSLQILSDAGLRYEHDMVEERVVKIRVYAPDPGKAVKDILVSGYIEGNAVNKTKERVEKWFQNNTAIVGMEQQGDFGMKLRIAAKVDLSGMDPNNLYFYSYDRKTNKYTRVETEYKIDANGYLHFNTVLAGDIVVSDGRLVKLNEMPVQPAPNPTTGGDGITDPFAPGSVAAPASGSTATSAPANMYHPSTGSEHTRTTDAPLSLQPENRDHSRIAQTASVAVKRDAPDSSQNSSAPNRLLIAGLLVLAIILVLTFIPRNDDELVSNEEYRNNHP